jgi:coiled-coil domain-containing protein 61
MSRALRNSIVGVGVSEASRMPTKRKAVALPRILPCFEMTERDTVSGTFVFRGVDYLVSVMVSQSVENPEQEVLLVDVQEKSTAEQWRGEFQPSYIKDLTQKTGNFKQFPVFVDMLKSAIMKTSSSVTLDLMTFSDLEQLRSRQGHKPRQTQAKSGSHVTNKRYLILTYTVEFDRVHYPLQLPYVGKPDPVAQQTTIRKLQSELERLKRQVCLLCGGDCMVDCCQELPVVV